MEGISSGSVDIGRSDQVAHVASWPAAAYHASINARIARSCLENSVHARGFSARAVINVREAAPRIMGQDDVIK